MAQHSPAKSITPTQAQPPPSAQKRPRPSSPTTSRQSPSQPAPVQHHKRPRTSPAVSQSPQLNQTPLPAQAGAGPSSGIALDQARVSHSPGTGCNKAEGPDSEADYPTPFAVDVKPVINGGSYATGSGERFVVVLPSAPLSAARSAIALAWADTRH